MESDYDRMRAEIKRLHNVCRAKDSIILECVQTIQSLLPGKDLQQNYLIINRLNDIQNSIL